MIKMIKHFWAKIVDYIAGTGAGRVSFPQFATVMVIVVATVMLIVVATVMLIVVVFVIPILVAFFD